MTERQAHLAVKRLKKWQVYDQGIWILLNTMLAIGTLWAKLYHQAAYVWAILILILFIGPRLYRGYQRKQRLFMQNNLVSLPPDWDKRMSVFTHLAGWQFVIFIGFGLAYFLPNPLVYIIIAVLYLVAGWVEYLARKKQNEAINYLQSYQPHEKID